MERLNRQRENTLSCSFLMSIATAMSSFKDEFSQAYADTLNILPVDNGLFHKAKKLRPDNIILLFQPSHSPELNPTLAIVGIPQAKPEVGVVQ